MKTALIVKEDGLIYVNKVPEEPEYCREFKGTDCQGSECHCMLHKIRYDRALASTKENAVLCADQEKAHGVIWRNYASQKDRQHGNELKPGIYPIPDLQWEIRTIEKFYEGKGWFWETVAILKESTPSTEQESQEELWNEAQLRIKNRLGTYSNDLVSDLARWAVEALKEEFTITRKVR